MNTKTTCCLADFAILASLILVGLATATATAQESGQTNAPPPNPYNYEPSTNKADVGACKVNLQKISTAILAYRKDHKQVPNWISDLVPKYLAEEALICPVTKRTERLSPFGALDPKLRCSYLYEFPPTPITDTIKSAWPGPLMTTRQWKQQQMGIVGSEVPIVRCLLHDPVLNLPYGGSIYESPVLWEQNFLDVANMEDFQPH